MLKNRPYKLIFTTLVGTIIFMCSSLIAYADPFTGAMVGAGAAGGYIIGGFGGSSAGSISGVIDNGVTYPGTSDWGTFVSDDTSINIHRDRNTGYTTATLSPDIAEMGYEHLDAFATYHGMQPGVIKSFGNYRSYGDYIFYEQRTIGSYTWYLGSIVFKPAAPDVQTTVTGTLYGCYLKLTGTGNSYNYESKMGTRAYNTGTCPPLFANGARFAFRPYGVAGYTAWIAQGATTANSIVDSTNTGLSGIEVVSKGYTVMQSQDGEVVDPDGLANEIVIDDLLENPDIPDNGTVTDPDLMAWILDRILEAYANAGVVSSEYVNPAPTPTPTPTPPPADQTIANTPWITLNDVFDDFKEIFGDIYDGITDFNESFGDWVDDVASGWTEVFGDIFDGITDGFDSVTGYLSDILDGLGEIVQSIEESLTDLITGFLNAFTGAFQSLFLEIKQRISIWHYVVEWLQNIGGTFTTFFTLINSVSYYYVLPIYAAFAGTVVIAVYRRFGK